MKKYDIIKNFLLGGCLGVTLMEISYFLVGFLIGSLNENIIRLIKIFSIIFFFGGIIYILAVISIQSLKYKDMQSREKQKVLNRQIRLTSIMIIILSFFVFLKSACKSSSPKRSYAFWVIMSWVIPLSSRRASSTILNPSNTNKPYWSLSFFEEESFWYSLTVGLSFDVMMFSNSTTPPE